MPGGKKRVARSFYNRRIEFCCIIIVKNSVDLVIRVVTALLEYLNFATLF